MEDEKKLDYLINVLKLTPKFQMGSSAYNSCSAGDGI